MSQQLYRDTVLLRTLSIGVLMRDLLNCRRGSVAFATVIALVPLIGAVALGAEAGTWYVTRQHAQNAADAAAFSGALSLACTISGATCAHSVAYYGKQFAAQSAFCNSGDTAYPGTRCATSLPTGTSQAVTIEVGDYNGTFTTPPAGTGNAVRATVSQTQPGYLAAVLNLTTVSVGAGAIALVQNPSKLCALALGPNPNGGGGALKIAGNVSNNGTGCPVMSDDSVQFASTPSFTGSGWAVLGVTGCSPTGTCASPGVAHNYFMPYANNPLSKLNGESFNTMPDMTMTGNSNPTNPVPCSTFSTLSPPPPVGATCYSVNANSAGTAYGTLGVNGGDYVAVVSGAPSTYFFNKNINVNGTGILVFAAGTYYFNGSFSGSSSGTIKFGAGTYYFNGNFSGGGGTVDFAPGTYFFNNSAISFAGGNVTCTACTPWPTATPPGTGLGVTLVLLGDSNISISGGANVSLAAPYTNTTSSDLNGVLIDDQAPNKSGNQVTINGGTVSLGGAMYFPNVDVNYNGSVQNLNTSCSEVIAKTLTMGGGGFLSTDGCLPNTIVFTQVVALVQ
jgi:Flp pilus assembly protein TadG